MATTRERYNHRRHNISKIVFERNQPDCEVSRKECKGPVIESGVGQQPAKAFMDDLTIATTHMVQTRWFLGGMEKLIKWARMMFKAKK